MWTCKRETASSSIPMESPTFSIHGVKCWVWKAYRNSFARLRSLPFQEMKQGILDRVAEWREGPPTDDVSLVLVDVL